MSVSYAVWISDPLGRRLARVEPLSLDYARAVNTVGTLRVTLPDDMDTNLLKIDGRVEVWRRVNGGPERLEADAIWLIRQIGDSLSDGIAGVQVIAVSALELLDRRIVAYASGSSEASKSGPADNLIKQIARENIGTLAGAERDLSSYLDIQADLSAAPNVSKGFSWRNVLTVSQEIAQASAQAGTPLYFDIVPSGMFGELELRTYTGLRGVDHTSPGGRNPVILSPETGTLDDVERAFDHLDEVNYVYAAGQGLGDERMVVEATDAARIRATPFNRREVLHDARQYASETGLTQEAHSRLREGRPKRRFSARIGENAGLRYGVEWGWGDAVTADYRGHQIACRVDAIQVTLRDQTETIQAVLRVEE